MASDAFDELELAGTVQKGIITMKVTPLDAIIALGRKLEELKQLNERVDISVEWLEADQDLMVLIPFALMIASKIEDLGFDQMSSAMMTPEFVAQLGATIDKYLPQ